MPNSRIRRNRRPAGWRRTEQTTKSISYGAGVRDSRALRSRFCTVSSCLTSATRPLKDSLQQTYHGAIGKPSQTKSALSAQAPSNHPATSEPAGVTRSRLHEPVSGASSDLAFDFRLPGRRAGGLEELRYLAGRERARLPRKRACSLGGQGPTADEPARKAGTGAPRERAD